MFKRSFSIETGRVAKPKLIKKSYPEHVKRKMQDSLSSPNSPPIGRQVAPEPHSLTTTNMQRSQLNSPIITMVEGRDQRLFAAHEDVLCRSPLFATYLKGQFLEIGRAHV